MEDNKTRAIKELHEEGKITVMYHENGGCLIIGKGGYSATVELGKKLDQYATEKE